MELSSPQGRAGQKGHAVTLIVERDAHALRGIVEAYGPVGVILRGKC